jgi:hypothetical protein
MLAYQARTRGAGAPPSATSQPASQPTAVAVAGLCAEEVDGVVRHFRLHHHAPMVIVIAARRTLCAPRAVIVSVRRGLILLDEVQVAPADLFRKCVTKVGRAACGAVRAGTDSSTPRATDTQHVQAGPDGHAGARGHQNRGSLLPAGCDALRSPARSLGLAALTCQAQAPSSTRPTGSTSRSRATSPRCSAASSAGPCARRR